MLQELIISTLQFDIEWENRDANLNKIESYLNNLPTTHLLVLPEMFSTGFTIHSQQFSETMDGITLRRLKKWAKEKSIIIVGSLIIEENNHYYNRLCWVYPNGNIFTYDKKHLFSFAEENKYYTAGHKRLITSVNGWRILSLVCYDLRFPVWCRQNHHNDEYDMMICVANWPATRIAQWEKLLMARAIENQCFMIGVNRVVIDNNGLVYDGNTLVVNPLGEILYKKTNQEELQTHIFNKKELVLMREHFHFGKDADPFILMP